MDDDLTIPFDRLAHPDMDALAKRDAFLRGGMNCSDCKYTTKTADHEYECQADKYDIDEKTCFVPRGVDDDDFKPINRIAWNSEFLGEILGG